MRGMRNALFGVVAALFLFGVLVMIMLPRLLQGKAQHNDAVALSNLRGLIASLTHFYDIRQSYPADWLTEMYSDGQSFGPLQFGHDMQRAVFTGLKNLIDRIIV